MGQAQRPLPTLWVQNGDWTCSRCGEPLGAIKSWDGDWQAHIPASCPSRAECEKQVIATVEGMPSAEFQS